MDSVISEELYSSVNLEQFVNAICQCHGAAWWILGFNLYLFIYSHEIKGLKFRLEVKNFPSKKFFFWPSNSLHWKLCHFESLYPNQRAINIHIWCMAITHLRDQHHISPLLTKYAGLQNAYVQKTNLLPVLPVVPSCFHAADPTFSSQKAKPP